MRKRVEFFLVWLIILIFAVQADALKVYKGNIPKEILSDPKEHEYVVVEDLSKIEFHGRSTLHKFHGLTDEVHGFIRVSPKHVEDAECEVYFKAKSLHTEKRKLNENMWENLEAEKYPLVKYKLRGVKVLSLDLNEGRGRFLISGDLTLHNVTRSITFPVDAEYVNGFFRFTGKYRINMKDYKIKPHSFLFFIRVKKDVDIKFDIYAKLKERK